MFNTWLLLAASLSQTLKSMMVLVGGGFLTQTIPASATSPQWPEHLKPLNMLLLGSLVFVMEVSTGPTMDPGNPDPTCIHDFLFFKVDPELRKSLLGSTVVSGQKITFIFIISIVFSSFNLQDIIK